MAISEGLRNDLIHMILRQLWRGACMRLLIDGLELIVRENAEEQFVGYWEADSKLVQTLTLGQVREAIGEFIDRELEGHA